MESKSRDQHSVVGTLVFLKRLDRYKTEKPYCIHVPASAVPGGKHTNEEDDSVETTIQDLRHHSEALDIDISGFEVMKCSSTIDYPDFSSKEAVENIFLPKIESVIKDKFGASHAWVYDWKIRRRSAMFPAHKRGGDASAQQPAPGVHVDFKPESLLPMMEKRQSGQTQALLGARLQAINFWRPLFGPLQDWPLAVCDYTSLDLGDLVPVDHVYPHKVEETYSVHSNPSQRWFYLRDQQPDEAIIFKTYDSDVSVARCVPHASFALPNGPTHARLRESIEVRLFVSYY